MNALELRLENAIRPIVGRRVSVMRETDQLPETAQGVVRIIIENSDDSAIEEIEECGVRMQGVLVRAECSSRVDNPDLATELATKLRRELPDKVEDGSLMFLSDYLESEGVNEEEGRYVVSAVFDGGHTL